MDPKARVLTVGLDPAVVDYTLSPIPGLTAEKLVAALDAEHAKLTALGYDVTTLYVDDGKTAIKSSSAASYYTTPPISVRRAKASCAMARLLRSHA